MKQKDMNLIMAAVGVLVMFKTMLHLQLGFDKIFDSQAGAWVYVIR